MPEWNLNQTFIQLCQRCIVDFGRGIPGLNFNGMVNMIYLMINIVGEEKVIEMLKKDKSEKLRKMGENWYKSNGMKRELEKINKIVHRTLPAFNKLEDKTIKDKDKPSYREFINYAKKVPLIHDNISALFVFFIENSNLKLMGIPSDLWRQPEMKGSRLGDLSRRPHQIGSISETPGEVRT